MDQSGSISSAATVVKIFLKRFFGRLRIQMARCLIFIRSTANARITGLALPYTRRRTNQAFSMLGFVGHMGIKVDQEPHSQSKVGTAAPAVAAVPSALAYTRSAVL
jgi:hypothetical protein